MDNVFRKGDKMNKWREHVRKVMKANPGKSLKDVLQLAKKSYRK